MDNYFYRKLVFAKSKSSGTSNYADLSNKPQINGVTLDGNKTSEDLGIEQGVTEEVLTQALAAESAAREKQDELLQGEIEGKIAAANIKAGNGINVSQEGNNVTINSTVQPKTYTAGTNIEITEDNVINNTIPYNSEAQSSVILGDINVGEGLEVSNSVYIGSNGTQNANDFYRNIIIGNNFNGISGSAIAIGHNCSSSTNSIALGNNARATSENQCVIGGFGSYINNVSAYTSSGMKKLAFVDQIPEETPIATTELVGKVKPDGTSITIDEDGTLHSVGVTQEYVNNIVSQLQTKITELEAKVTALEASTSETS